MENDKTKKQIKNMGTKMIILVLVLGWFVGGIYSIIIEWTQVSKFDLTVNDLPCIIFFGSICGVLFAFWHVFGDIIKFLIYQISNKTKVIDGNKILIKGK